MWLPGLHIPESYITALVQLTCRSKGWPLDKFTVITTVTTIVNPAAITQRPTEGCYIHGLYLEGAGWDVEKARLKQQENKVLITEMPVMHIIPIQQHQAKIQNTFLTPVYVTQARRSSMGTGLVFNADLATTVHHSHWVLQGCALVLNKDD